MQIRLTLEHVPLITQLEARVTYLCLEIKCESGITLRCIRLHEMCRLYFNILYSTMCVRAYVCTKIKFAENNLISVINKFLIRRFR